MKQPRRAIHLDFHTMPAVPDVGADFDGEEFARTLAEARVDYVTVFAKCNLGMAYYPTKVGVPHPSLKRDLLGEMVEACKRRDIAVAAYFNAGIDHEQCLRRREWCKVTREGYIYKHHERQENDSSHTFRVPCLNTGYGPYLLSMVEEVLRRYPVDGIFLDCFNPSPCYGIECLDGMKRLGMNESDDSQAYEYCWSVTENFQKQVERLVRARRKGISLFCNGRPYRRQPTHIEVEVLPTNPAWGYDTLPALIRYARTHGKPFFTMTGRFQKSWGDFGGLRPEHSLLFDCYYSLANGGACSVGDHLHPRGRLEPSVYQLIGTVYEKIEQLEPWVKDSRGETEIAVIEPGLRRFPPQAAKGLCPVMGAARMLSELKQQFDICDGHKNLSQYRVLILPDYVAVDGALKRKLQAHLKRGGILISSAFAGLDPAGKRFALSEYRLAYDGPEPHDPAFIVVGDKLRKALPDMPITIYTPGIAMRLRKGAVELAEIYQPYFNQKHWNGRHDHLYVPPQGPSGRPALARSRRVFHFSFPLFEGYHEHAVVAYREMLRACLNEALPEPLVRVEGMPSFGQVTVTRRRRRRMIHLLTYVPELRGRQSQIIEEPVTVRGVKVSLRKAGRAVQRAYLAPSRTPLDVEQDDTYAHVTVPEVSGYQLLVFEE